MAVFYRFAVKISLALAPLFYLKMRKIFLFFLSIIASCAVLAGEAKITRQEYIDFWKQEAIYQMAMHHIPASITMAQGILESGDGNSRLAREGNNHFGIKCHNEWTGEKIYEDDETRGECFRKYNNARDSYEDHSLFLQKKRYEPLFKLRTEDYRAWAKGLKECGYATNPSYPQLLIRIIEEFSLHELDEEGLDFIKKGEVPERAGESKTAARIPSAHEKDKSKSSKRNKQDKNSSEERSEITIRNNREVLLNENRTRYVIAKDGDSPEKIAGDIDLHVAILRKYNDFDKDHQIKAGDIVYLQPKRMKVKADSYTALTGDTARSVSQVTGLKLKRLCKLNGLKPDEDIPAGRVLKLKK